MGVTTRSMKKVLKNAAPQGVENGEERGTGVGSNTGVVANEDVVQGIDEDRVSAKGGDTATDEALNKDIFTESAPKVTPLTRGSRKGARRTIKKPKQSTKPRSCVQATSSKRGPDKENSFSDTSSEILSAIRVPKGVRLVPPGARPETGTVVPPKKRGREETKDGEDLDVTRTDGRRVRRRGERTSATTANSRPKAKGDDCLYCLPALLEVTSRLWEEEQVNAVAAHALLELRIPSDFRRREEEQVNAVAAHALLELRIPSDFRRRKEELNRREREFQEAEFRHRLRRANPYYFEDSDSRTAVSEEED